MIEVIYKEEKQEAKGNEGMFAVPRNIRQIGLPGEGYRIYAEDYVYTFLVRLAGTEAQKEKEKGHLAVLTGETKWQGGVTYVFIRGAITVDDAEAAVDHIDFTEKVWARIHDEQELYFPKQEVVGWFFARQELSLEATEVFKRVHLKHFGGEKVLMLMDPAEREDAFFCYENNFLMKQPGYYLFYEKNPQMQNYMLDKNQEIPSEQTEVVPDEAVVAFRKIIRTKKKTRKYETQEKKAQEKKKAAEEPEQEDRPSVFSYAATACLAIAVLAVGVNFYRNYQTGYSARQQVKTASATITKESGTEVTVVPTTGATQTSSAKSEKSEKASGSDDSAKENDAAQGTESESEEESSGDQVAAAAGQSQEEAQAYQEESDVRKAKRKQALAEQEETEQNAAEAKQNAVGAEPNAAETESNAAETTKNEEETGQETSTDSVHSSYVIRPGDTLYQISIEKYGNMEAIAEICALNGISQEEIIYPGQVIVLP